MNTTFHYALQPVLKTALMNAQSDEQREAVRAMLDANWARIGGTPVAAPAVPVPKVAQRYMLVAEGRKVIRWDDLGDGRFDIEAARLPTYRFGGAYTSTVDSAAIGWRALAMGVMNPGRPVGLTRRHSLRSVSNSMRAAVSEILDENGPLATALSARRTPGPGTHLTTDGNLVLIEWTPTPGLEIVPWR